MAKIREFIVYDKNNRTKTGDFSGPEEAIGAEERVRFLQAYSKALDRQYNLENGSKKVATDGETQELLSRISYRLQPSVRKTLRFDEMTASLKPSVRAYKGWQLYTDRVRVEKGAIVFQDGWTPPVPCAKYEFSNGNALKSLKLRVFVSTAYAWKELAKDCEKLPPDTATGRIVEVRSGIAELVKIQFYADGRAFACVGIPDRYHHTKISLGRYSFDQWNELEIVFHGESFDCSLNGETVRGISFTDQGVPDSLFFSGGMHAVDFWRVQPVESVYERETQTDFFMPEERRKEEEIPLGEVRLPYGVGGYPNRDKILILRKDFYCDHAQKALLTVDTLDPGGEIYLNGKQICKTDGFLRQVCPLDGLATGKNRIEIFVSSRAPEKPYCWHRCDDTYNAWLCGGVKIDILADVYITSLRVVTERVNPQISARFNVEFNKKTSGRIRVFLRKTNPNNGLEREIYVGKAQGKNAVFQVDFDGEAWSPENPALYAVRVQLEDDDGTPIDDFIEETGFRTIEQKDGDLQLNGEKICLKGALIMQFLPPYENILKSHTCPTDQEIVWQLQALKKMNANVARLHVLGYGTNDERFARFCDRLGLAVIWTTRFIDSVESVKWSGEWKQKDGYLKQIQEVLNHPSIIIWEGSNEFHAGRKTQDALYDQFVSAIKSVDTTRLICPCSHLYYGGGLYGDEGFYYQDDGLADQDFEKSESSFGWRDPLVVRSAHTYDIMLGYGTDWGTFRKQGWKSEKNLFESKHHAYLVSEIAVIGRHDDRTAECQTYVKNDSYELGNEDASLGVHLTQQDWKISQAYQALAAQHIVKSLLSRNADGIMWCCLSGGANDGSYLKPPIDFYGYAKYAFYLLRDCFRREIGFNRSSAVVFGKNSTIEPTLVQLEKNKNYTLTVRVLQMDETLVDETRYTCFSADTDAVFLPKWKPKFIDDGYYFIEYDVQRVE